MIRRLVAIALDALALVVVAALFVLLLLTALPGPFSL